MARKKKAPETVEEVSEAAQENEAQNNADAQDISVNADVPMSASWPCTSIGLSNGTQVVNL